MGFFDFLKKKKEEEVKFSEVDAWIERHLEDKGLDTKVKSLKNHIESRISEARELLEKLEQASLLNENIPERVKHIMEGNRKNYLRKINQFLDDLRIPGDYLKIREFSKKFTEDLDSLSEETQKSYFVLKEFLESELVAVVKKIKEIEDLAIDFRQEIEKENLHKVEKLKEKLEEFKNSKEALANLETLKQEQEEELKELKKKENSTEKKISKLRNSSSYKDYERLKSEKEKAEGEIQKKKTELIAHFSTLEKAFKKYKRMSLNEALIEKYLDDPTKALLEDEPLKILEVLSKMKQSLADLGLKDKKEEKTKEEIDNLSKEMLTKLREKFQELFDKEKENKKNLLSNTSVMNISEQESFLENAKLNVKEKEREIEDSGHKIERINPKLVKQQVRDMLKEFSVIMKNG
ncbi:hypothetical protein HQ533_01200 [Candidatus Woesearchaeota archaeon]|nr:hypothetical protein [Candidatus Woesearchaeota archaeon]